MTNRTILFPVLGLLVLATLAAAPHATSANADDRSDVQCPVTIPTPGEHSASSPDAAVYSEHLPAPDPYPNQYPHDGMVWYGTSELWTALATDGEHWPRKSVWWSSSFAGGIIDEAPEVWVTWTRLDIDPHVEVDNGGKATNAYTPEEGWFMIAGIDPSEPGCWQVEASYKGTSLSYVYEAW